jgi:hypothetical protein
VVASYQRPSSPSLLLPQLQRPYWICRPAAILLHIPSPTSSSFLQELEVRGPAAVAMATRAMCFFFVLWESNRKHAFVLISDYNVIQDVVLKTCSRCVSLFSCGASPLRFSHLVVGAALEWVALSRLHVRGVLIFRDWSSCRHDKPITHLEMKIK